MRRAVLLACACSLAVLVALALRHAWRVPFYAGDDQIWRAHAARGLASVWTEPSPFHHYRPVFGTWLHALHRLGADSPSSLALATLVLYLAASALALYALRPLLDPEALLLAATLLALHPARQEQLFWTSGGMDTLALAGSLLCLGVALRALRAERVPPWRHAVLALITALAVLSKEVAAALPLLVLLLPGPAPLRRRLSLAAASGAGAVAAVTAWLVVIRGGGRPAGLLADAGSPVALLYPTRLVWPGDLHDGLFRAKQGAGVLPLVVVIAVSAVACVLLARAWRGRWDTPAARMGLLLALAGLLPWLIRQDDRALGLGAAGMAVLLSGSRRAVVLALLPALCWLPLWLRAETRWTEASRLSERVISALRGWRAEAPAESLLVPLGAPATVGWTSEVAGVGELDRCALDLLAVLGPDPWAPIDVAREEGGRLRVATDGAVLRWGSLPAPSLGVLSVTIDDAGYTRGAVLDPLVLHDVSARRGCHGVEIRRWDGDTFRPLP